MEEEGRRQAPARSRPESEHVRTESPDLAIVPLELWERVQAKIGKRSKPGRRESRTSSSFALSGLLKCGVCGGSFGGVGQAKRDGKRWRTLGCNSAKDRRCANSRTISERRVRAALGDYLRDKLSRPDRVETFVAAFQARWRELEEQDSPATMLGAQEAALTGRRRGPGDGAGADVAGARRAVGGRGEEVDRPRPAAPRGDDEAAEDRPAPGAIARYVTELREALEGGDPAAAGRMLRRALAPFTMKWVEGTGYFMSGALDVSVCSEKVAGARYRIIQRLAGSPSRAPFSGVPTDGIGASRRARTLMLVRQRASH